MMSKHYCKILVILSFILSNYNILPISRSTHRYRIFLEHGERLVVPKRANLKLIHPIVISSKPSIKPNYNDFSGEFEEIALRPIKWPTIRTSGGKFLSDFKNGAENINFDLFEPSIDLEGVVPVESTTTGQDFQDIKPVTEHIEDDIKYDFRTKTHSI